MLIGRLPSAELQQQSWNEWRKDYREIWRTRQIFNPFEITAQEEPEHEPNRDVLETWILGDELEDDTAGEFELAVQPFEFDDDLRDGLAYDQLVNELETELHEVISAAPRGTRSSYDGRGQRQRRSKRGKRGSACGLLREEMKTYVGRKPAKPRKHRPAKPAKLRADEGTKRDVNRLLRRFRAMLPEQQRDAAEFIAPLAGAGLTTEAVLASPGDILTALLSTSKDKAHRRINEMRRAAGRERLTGAERQQCFNEHDQLKRRLAEQIAEAGRCRFAEMSSAELVALAIDDLGKESEIRRELIAFGTSAANSGRRKRDAMALFHAFDSHLRAEQERRAVGTEPSRSGTVPEYQGTVPDDGIEL